MKKEGRKWHKGPVQGGHAANLGRGRSGAGTDEVDEGQVTGIIARALGGRGGQD